MTVTDLKVDGFPAPFLPAGASNKLTLHRYQAAGAGAPAPRIALVLLPCAACGAGWLDPLAREVAARGGVALFTLDRRGVALEERERLDRLRLGASKEAAGAIAWYLGAEGKPPLWDRPGAEKLRYMALWGSRLMHEDLRAVAREVKRLTSLPVAMGGFSGGAGSVLGFAARRFDDGRAGHEEVAGIVLLDGGSRLENEVDQAALREGMETWLAGQQLNGAFWEMRDDQIRAEIGALLALEDPAGRSPLARGPVPEDLARAGMTNQAFFGWTLDLGGATEQGALGRLYQIQMGSLVPPSAPGRLAEWLDGGREGEPVRLAQVAAAARAPGGIFDWYYPSRLVREESALFVNGYNDPDLGVTEVERISVPLFTVTTASASILGPDRPALSGTWLFGRIPAQGNEAYTLPEMRHSDILFAVAAREGVFAPLHRWLMKLSPVAAAPAATGAAPPSPRR